MTYPMKNCVRARNRFSRLYRLVCVILLLCLAIPCMAQTDAERASELRNDIANDQARLEQIKEDLVIQEERFEESNAALGQLLTREKDLKLALELEDLEEDRRTELEAELAALRDLMAREAKKADLVFQSLRADREEIRLLELALAQETAALNKFLGETDTADNEQPIAGFSESMVVKQAENTTQSSGVSSLIPGSETAPVESRSSEIFENIGLSKSATQIQARIAAERAAVKAFEAEVLLNEAVELKQSLANQIKVETSQVELADQSLRVMQQEVLAIEAEIEAAMAAERGTEAIEEANERLAQLEARISGIEQDRDARVKHISDLSERMATYEQDIVLISADVDASRQKAARAKTRHAWLNSAANPRNMIRWAKERGPGILVVLLIMVSLLWMIRFFARRIIRGLVRSAQTDRTKRELRADTLGSSLAGVLMGFVVVIAFLVVMQQAGVDVTTVLGGAAILGVAVAFGAQNLMKDMFNGVMILWEDQYSLSDLVEINGVSGKVERVTMRTTVLRDIEGQTHFIPNGMITHVTNRSYEWSRAMLDVPVPYDCDIDRAMEILLDEANAFCEDMNYTTAVSDKPVMLGVNEFAESSITIRFYIKTAAYMQMPVRREMLRRIKNRFDQEGIEIPFPHRVMINRD